MSDFRHRALCVLAEIAENEAADDELRLQAASQLLYVQPSDVVLCMICRGCGLSKRADGPCEVCGGAGRVIAREPQEMAEK